MYHDVSIRAIVKKMVDWIMIMGLHKNKAIDNHGHNGKPSNDGTINYWITMINSLAISGT
jgi:hypothetical protein